MAWLRWLDGIAIAGAVGRGDDGGSEGGSSGGSESANVIVRKWAAG